MPILIDGYNLLHVTGIFGSGPRSFQHARERLIQFLAGALDPKDVAATTVVFDAAQAPPGLPHQMTMAGINVQFARKHQTADELLEDLILADRTPRRTTVVSSDHQVQRAARRRRATAVDSDVWFSDLIRNLRERDEPEVSDQKPSPPATEAEIQWWVRQFGNIQTGDMKDTNPKTRNLGNTPHENPFPPGYGHDVLDEES